MKTSPNEASVTAFLDGVEPAERQSDCRALLTVMERITGSPARMWGPSIVGFGQYHYRYSSGREGDWFLVGFAPRKQSLTVYLTSGLEDQHALLGKLGKHKIGKGCLYLKRLSDGDPEVLEDLIRSAIQLIHDRYPDA